MTELKGSKFFILIAAGLVFIGVAGWKYMDFNAEKEYIAPPPTKNMPIITPPTSPPTGNTGGVAEDSITEESATGGPSKVQPNTYTISMNSSGFSPANLTIKAGDTVRFVNNDTTNHWPASDVHPVHAIYPEFDARADIIPGGEWSFTFEKVGEWGMHDHRSPVTTGKIIVE